MPLKCRSPTPREYVVGHATWRMDCGRSSLLVMMRLTSMVATVTNLEQSGGRKRLTVQAIPPVPMSSG
jgi:hypothetical protein